MKKILLSIAGIAIFFHFLHAQDQPKREFRGAWVATYFSIDWPNRTHTPQQQRDAFITIANHHQQTGITTMYLQVRSQSDAMYKSDIEPWGFYLTPLKLGGNEPSEDWDPMKFAIEECHKRGIEFHAWLNPYRAIGNINNSKYFSPDHVVNQHPDWMITNNLERIMDPGLPQVRDHIHDVVMEIVNNYDVDGIHFDDYFYPNAVINDDATFAAHNRGFTNRADWRRDNVNLLIQAVSENIKLAKPWVEFGVSPSGIWRNGGEGSATGGLQHYVSLYADSRKWLQEGWIDYLCPQVYWYIGQPGADYKVLIPWWNNNANGRLIYIGMAGYKVGISGQGLFTTDRSMIPKEVRMNRDAAYPNIHGQAIYNTSSLRNNNLNFRDSLKDRFYHVPALQPAMPWIDATAPAAAADLTADYDGTYITLNWNNPPEAANEMDKAKQLVIYRSENGVVDITKAHNILAITPSMVSTFTDHTAESGKSYHYQVTTLDRLHNESVATNSVQVCTYTPFVTIADAYALPSGVLANTVFLGYEPAGSLTLVAEASNGTSPYTYIWSDGSTGSSATVSPISNTTYSVLVTDNNGCKADLVETDVEVIDVRAGYNNDKVRICHLRGIQSTLEIAAEDIADHLAHGDMLSGCAVPAWMVKDQQAVLEQSIGKLVIKAYPNPSNNYFTISLQGSETLATMNLRVMDVLGRTVEQKNNLQSNEALQIGKNYQRGIYFVEVSNGTDKTILKLVKQ